MRKNDNLLMTRINVLNKGFVKLEDYAGGDLKIVRAARQSFNAEWRAGEDQSADAKLINYLLKNGHTSPFEHVVFTFTVKAPIFVLRQWHRHRTQSYSEISARYTKMKDEYYVPAEEQITTQSKSNKQGRTDEQNTDSEELAGLVNEACAYAFRVYNRLLEKECPRELARVVLPLGTYSQMSTTLNLHNLFHFLKLRLHPHTQYEIRVYAQAMLELIEPIVPVACGAFRKFVLNGDEQ